MWPVFDALLSLTDVGSAQGFLLGALAAFAAGLMIAFAYMFRSVYTRGFAVTLALLPVVVQSVICIVNGNLGTGVAVMGAFSLVRFRSAPGGAREICSVFLAMAAGLAAGTGYLVLALALAAGVSLLSVLLMLMRFGEMPSRHKALKITIPESLDYTGVFDDLPPLHQPLRVGERAHHQHGQPLSPAIPRIDAQRGARKGVYRRAALPQRQSGNCPRAHGGGA